jgi:LmbE family N-acetylglucosaminyl deacetylase
MRPEPLAVPSRALAIGAHPDDVEFGAGGTLAGWAAAGCEVSIIVVTDGSKGTWDPSVAPADLAASRAGEQKEAAAALGVTGEVIVLDHVDGELEYTMALREEMCLWIRRLQPEVVLSHDPWRRYMLHPDHRAAGWGVVDGVVAARDHLFFPNQGLDKHRPSSVLLWSPDQADHWEDISPWFEAKLAALRCHSSQSQSSMSGTDAEAFEARMREWAAEQGQPVGLPLAESFHRIAP